MENVIYYLYSHNNAVLQCGLWPHCPRYYTNIAQMHINNNAACFSFWYKKALQSFFLCHSSRVGTTYMEVKHRCKSILHFDKILSFVQNQCFRPSINDWWLLGGYWKLELRRNKPSHCHQQNLI